MINDHSISSTLTLRHDVGLAVGLDVGLADGLAVGLDVGLADGLVVGFVEGDTDGWDEIDGAGCSI